MARALAFVGGAAVLAGALTAPVGTAPVRPPPRTVVGSVQGLAMDGPVVAYNAAVRGCLEARVWAVGQPRDPLVSGNGTCRAGRSPFNWDFTAVAVAGSRLAWVTVEMGLDEEYDTMWAASLPRGGERKLAQTAHFESPTRRTAGTQFQRLKGSGDLIVADVLDVRQPPTDSLQRVTPHGLAPLVASEATITDFDTDSNRVAVLRGGAVEIRSSSGALIRSIPEPKAVAVAVDGDRVVAAAKRSIAVYDSASGDRVSTWPLAHRLERFDAAQGLAAYTDGEAIYAVDLASGNEQ